MTWQTWVVHLGWLIQNTFGIIVLCQLLTLKYNRSLVAGSYAIATTLFHIARSYFFIHMPLLPSEEVFFVIIVPIYTYLFMRFVCYDKSMKIVLWIIILYTYSVLGHVLTLVVCYLVLGESFYFDFVSDIVIYTTLIATVILVTLYLLFYFVLKMLIGRIRSDIPNIIALILIMSGQLVYGISQLLSFLSQNEQVNPQIAMGIILMIVGNIVILKILLTNSKKQEAEEGIKELQHVRELEQMHYTQIEARRQELAKVRHDFNNQMAVVHQLIISDEKDHAEEMLNELKQTLINTTEHIYCQNTIVNAVLTEKQKQCDSSDILLETDVLIDEKCSISSIHLCSIFTNLLDNAIEACKTLPSDKRKIEIRTAVKGAYLHIKSVNPVANQPDNEHSRKGYGNIILSDIASNYYGNFTAERVDDKYIAMISVHYV